MNYSDSLMMSIDYLREQSLSKDDKIQTADTFITNLQNQIY